MVTRHPWINHGRWVTRCWCGEHVAVERDEPKAGHWSGGDDAELHTVTVVWPRHRREAEQILAQRPTVNRNWTPTMEAASLNGSSVVETIDDLRQENREHL